MGEYYLKAGSIQISLKIKFKFFIRVSLTFMVWFRLLHLGIRLSSCLPSPLSWPPCQGFVYFPFVYWQPASFPTLARFYSLSILILDNSTPGWCSWQCLPPLLGSLVFLQKSDLAYIFIHLLTFPSLTRWKDPQKQTQLLQHCISNHSLPGTM